MADFRIQVVIDPAKAVSGSRRVESSLNRVGAAAVRVQRLLMSAFAIGSIGVGIVASIRLLANFEQQMASVRAISGATAEQFVMLRDKARELGSTTVFSASEAASGMVFLARAGFEVDEVMSSIGGTLLLAQAGALDLGRAADIASNILQGFRLRASQATEVVDILALAANSSNTNVTQLGDAMKFVAPVAAGLGVSIQETTAAISALSNAGLQASLAGTGLRRVLSELESPSAKTRGLLDDLGISVNDVKISGVGLTAALNVLADAGVDAGTAMQLFGQRGGPAFEVLKSSIPTIEAMTEQLGDAEGSAERMADIMNDNLNGALIRAKSAAEGLLLAFGAQGTSSGLTGAANGLAALLRALSKNVDTLVVAVETLAAVFIGRLVVSVAAATGQLVALEFALGATSATAAVASIAMKRLQAAMLFLAANPLGAVIIGVGAIAAAMSLVETSTEKVKRISGELEGQVNDLRDAYDEVKGKVEDIRDAVEGTTLSQALQTQREAATELSAALLEVQLGLDVMAQSRHVPRELSQQFTDMATAISDGTLSTSELIVGLDRIGQENPKLQGMVNTIIEQAQATKGFQDAIDKADAVVRVLSGTATDADYALLGFGTAARDAADGADTLTTSANTATSALRTLQSYVPSLDRAAKAHEDLTAAQEAYRQGIAEVAAGRAAGELTILDEIAEVDTLQRTYRLARDEISGLGDASRELDRYIAQVNADAEDSPLARAAAQAKVEYEALVEQLNMAGASQEQLTAARKAYELELQAISQQHADGGGGGGTLISRDDITNMAQAVQYLDQQNRLLRMTNQERAISVELQKVEQKLAQHNVTLSAKELELLRQKIELNQQLETTLGFVGDVAEATFGGIDDAVAEFIRTGKFSFKDFATSVVADLARIAVQALLVKPLIEGIVGAFGGSGFTFNQPNIGSLFSAPAAAPSIPGNQFGGSVVGGSGGPDSQLYVTRVSPGERIDFTPAGEGSPRNREGTTINFNITTPDVEGFRRSQGQLAATAARIVGSGKRNL